MAKKQNEVENESGYEGFTEQKLSMDIRPLTVIGSFVIGIFKGIEEFLDADGKPMPSDLNPADTIKIIKFENPLNGDQFAVWHNRGLAGKLNFCRVKEGMLIKVTYKGKSEYDGKPVNDYDVVGLTRS